MNSPLLFINKKKLEWIFIILITIPTVYSLFRPGFFSMHDDLQAFRVHQMDKCIQDLQIPCRWVPDMGFEYGYPQYNYYPPSIYYLAEVFHLVGFQFIDTVKIIVILGFVLSALFMYLFLREWLGKWPAFVGAALYAYEPYKAVDAYVRGALSEFWALVFFPLIFWSAYRLVKRNDLKSLVFFAISVFLLLITHNLMTLIFIPLAGLWVLAWIILEKKWKLIPKFIAGAILGLGLAAFFTLPVTFEKQYVHLESIIGGYFDYRLHFTNLNQLFISNFFDYGSSVWGPKDDLSLSVGHIQWLFSVFALLLSLITFKSHRKLSILTILLFGLAFFSIFLTHQKSAFVWDILGFLTWLQFPWRFLANAIFLLSILSAIAIYLLKEVLNKKEFQVSVLNKFSDKFLKRFDLSVKLGVFSILAAIILYGNFFKPHAWINITDEEKFSGASWEKQLTVSIFDYLPIYAKLPPIRRAPDLPEVMKGDVKFLSYKKGSNYQIGEYESTQSANVRLPLFDFPGMKVSIDGSRIEHNHNDCSGQEFCLGLISADIPAGKHKIETKLTDTPVRTAGNLITLISLIAVTVLLIKDARNKKIHS